MRRKEIIGRAAEICWGPKNSRDLGVSGVLNGSGALYPSSLLNASRIIAILGIGLCMNASMAQDLPSYWTDDTGLRVVPEEGRVQEGLSSLAVEVNSNDEAQCDLRNKEIGVTPGNTYSLSFYYNTSAHVRVQAVLEWSGAATTFAGSYGGDNTDDAVFTLYTLNGTVPAGAAAVKIGVRFEDQAGFTAGEWQYLDGFTFESPASVSMDLYNGGFEQWQSRNWLEVLKQAASDGFDESSFGLSVAISGDYAVVGAPYENGDASGTNYLSDPGAAYILYKHQGGTDAWGEVKKIVAGNWMEEAYFGTSVDISGDYITVGCPGENNFKGAAYVFFRNHGSANSWGQLIRLEADDPTRLAGFGIDVAIDGDRVLVGAIYEPYNATGTDSVEFAGAAYLYEKDYPSLNSWGLRKKLVAGDRTPDAGFGRNVDLYGDYAVASAIGNGTNASLGEPLSAAGAVYVFHKDQGSPDAWGQAKKIVPDERYEYDRFGSSLSLNENLLAVGTPGHDYDAVGGNFLSYAGAVFVFDRNAGGENLWGQQGKITASDRTAGDEFGESLKLFDNYLVATARRNKTDEMGGNPMDYAGSVYSFYKDMGGLNKWGELRKMVAKTRQEKAYFGTSVDMEKGYCLVGAPGEGTFLSQVEGEVYLYRNPVQSGSILFSAVGTDQFTVNCSPGDGEKRAIFMREGNGEVILPVDGDTYSANSIFRSGSQIGESGWYCVYNGTGSSVTITGLNNNTNYRVLAIEYSGAPNSEMYVPFTDEGNPAYQKMGSILADVGHHVGSGLLTSTTADMQYSLNSSDGSDGDWLDCLDGNTEVIFITGDVWLRQKSVPSNFRLLATVPPAPSMPAFSISYVGETSAEMIPATVEFNTDNDFITTNINGEGNAIALTPGTDFYFRVKSTATTLPGPVQQMQVPARPILSGYTIDYHNETTLENIPDTVEYAEFPDMTGALAGGDSPAFLNPGTDLYFRIMATGSSFRSEVYQLDVHARPAVSTNYSIDYMQEATLENVSTLDEYDSDPSMGSPVAGSGTSVVIAPGTDLYFRLRNTATDFASEIQQLVVAARPPKPAYSIDFKNEATAQNIELEHEYAFNDQMAGALDGGGLILDLEPGVSVYFRMKSTPASFAGELQVMIVPSRPSVPMVSLSGKNSAYAVFMKSEDGTGIQVGLADKMEYTMDGGINWIPITDYTMVDATGTKVIRVREMATTFLFASESTGNLDFDKPVVTIVDDVSCNGPQNSIRLQSSIDNGNVYIILEGEAQDRKSDLDAAVSADKGAKGSVSAAAADIIIQTGGIFAGIYNAYAVDNKDSLSLKSSGSITIHTVPIVSTGPDILKCDGEVVILDAGAQYSSYLWSPGGDNTRTKIVTAAGEYILTVSDENACLNSDSIQVVYSLPYDKEELCLVTIDLATGRNMLIWERTPDMGILSYRLYRQASVTGQYDLIGTLPYTDLSLFKDTIMDPEKQQYIYKITSVDTCGNESDLKVSPYHKPLFLQYISSVDGVNLEWEKYEVEGNPFDFVTYEIYRGSDSSSLTYLDEVSGDLRVYKDTDGSALLKRYFYRVAGVKENPCQPTEGRKAGTGPYRHSLSNMDDNKLKVNSTGETYRYGNIEIFPNPFKESVSIRFENSELNAYTLYIRDISGRLVRIVPDITGNEITILRGEFSVGIYSIELRGKEVFKGRMMVE